MTKKNLIKSIILPILTLVLNASAQPRDITIQITNQPNTEILLGSIKGDKFTPIDTTQPVNNTIHFKIPVNSQSGIYRIILGQTRVAQIMNEPPQQLDFIYNNEDITLKTDFKHPEDSLEILQSVENRVWYDFIKKEKMLKEQLVIAEKELDYYRTKSVGVTNTNNAVTNRITLYNQLQKEREKIIQQTIECYPNLYATKLIKMYQESFLDGSLDKQQRDQLFKSTFFNNLDFTDESLMNSDVYTKKVFNYLMS